MNNHNNVFQRFNVLVLQSQKHKLDQEVDHFAQKLRQQMCSMIGNFKASYIESWFFLIAVTFAIDNIPSLSQERFIVLFKGVPLSLINP